MSSSDDNESWGWIAFWFFGSFAVAMASPLLGGVSMMLALFYGAKRLFSS